MEFKLSEINPELRDLLIQFFNATGFEMNNKNMVHVLDLLQSMSILQAKVIIKDIKEGWIDLNE